MKRVLNWRPDRPDHRDYLFRDHMKLRNPKALPKVLNLLGGCPPIYDQGEIGSCTAQAWCSMLEYLQLMGLKDDIQQPEEFGSTYSAMSRLFLYFNERWLHKQTQYDSGAQLRDGMKASKKWGVCEESLWAYLPQYVFDHPTGPAYHQAAQHKIKNGYKIRNGDLHSLKSCLADGFPFVFGISVFDSFMNDKVAKTGIVPMPDTSESSQGGHAVSAIGYNDSRRSFFCRNSWGISWGIQGYFWLPYDYVANPGLASDFWTARL